MRKIILKILLTAVIIIMPLGVFASSVGLGDYIELGSYMGEPIVWRCVDVNETGSLMVADRIITLKSFDATGTKSNDPKGVRAISGSDSWSDSAIRVWLNSADTSVSYPNGHIPADANVSEGINGYSAEAGFLSDGNFTQIERDIILPVTISSVVSRHDTALATSGTELHKYVAEVGAAAANIESAYVKNTTDKVFLLGIQEVEAIRGNESVLGKEYFLAKPTSAAVEQSEYAYGNLSADLYYHYWLRDAVSFADGSEVRTMYHTSNDIRKANFNGYGLPSVNSNIAINGGVGVRPAIYIDAENVSVSGGEGTANSPYTVDNNPRVSISSDRKYTLKGESVTLETTATSIPDGATIRYYFNGAEVATLDTSFILNKVTNTFEAAVFSGTGAELSRTKFVAYTVLIEEKSKIQFNDFEGEGYLSGIGLNGTTNNSERAFRTVEDDNAYYTITVNAESQPVMVFNKISGKSGELVIEADMRINEQNTSGGSRPVFYLRPMNTSFIYPIEITTDGSINLAASTKPRVVASDMTDGEWHHIKIAVNSERKDYTVIIDDTLICAREELANKDFDQFSYLSVGPGRVTGGECSISFDNMNLYLANDDPRIMFESAGYGMTGDRVTVEADSYNMPEDAVISYYYNGESIPDINGEFVIKYLSNNFTAVAKDKQGTEIGRFDHTVHYPYFYEGDVLAESDFENPEAPMGDLRLGGGLAMEEVDFTDTKYGTTLKLTATPDKQPFVTTSAMNGKKGDIVIDLDMCFDEFNTTIAARSVFGLRSTIGGASGDFIYPVEFTSDRDIRIPFCETPYVIDVDFEDGRWYHITMVINPERRDITVVFDGKLLCSGLKIAGKEFDNISYMNMGTGRVRSGECELSVDNFRMYIADEPAFDYMFDDKGFKVINKKGVFSDAVVYFVRNGEVQHISKVNFANGEKEKHIGEDVSDLDLANMEIFIWNSNFRPLDRVTGIGR